MGWVPPVRCVKFREMMLACVLASSGGELEEASVRTLFLCRPTVKLFLEHHQPSMEASRPAKRGGWAVRPEIACLDELALGPVYTPCTQRLLFVRF